MELSIFEILGPVMIGPSSSHTAGAAKLARVAAMIGNIPFNKVSFGWSGSFAETGVGHGTDKALLAGALGLREDDERIRDVAALAALRGVKAEYYEEELDGMHENSVHITFSHPKWGNKEIWGSSTGGGRILITKIGDFETSIAAESPTVVVRHKDRPGVIGDVSQILAKNNINIAVLRLSREARGRDANTVFELDSPAGEDVVKEISGAENVTEVISIDVS